MGTTDKTGSECSRRGWGRSKSGQFGEQFQCAMRRGPGLRRGEGSTGCGFFGLTDLSGDKSARACLPVGRRDNAPAQADAGRLEGFGLLQLTPCPTAFGRLGNETDGPSTGGSIRRFQGSASHPHQRLIPPIPRQVLHARFRHQHLILQLDREIAALR